MTYKELGKYIAKLSPEQQEMAVTVHLSQVDEYYPLVGDHPVVESEESDVLEKGHPYLSI